MSGLILVGASPYYSLNPCCNGIYSMRYLCQVALQQETNCLNPCCNGIYSMSLAIADNAVHKWVLILVVMEYTQ